MSNEEKILKIVSKNKGVVTTKEVNCNNIDRIYLTRLVNKGVLTRIKKGLYVEEDNWGDEYFNLIYGLNAVYSYETALYLLGLCESVPVNYNLTVPRGSNTSLKNNDKVILHFVKKEIFDIGKQTIKSPQGQLITCYNAERTICDLLKDKQNQDVETVKYAIKEYLENKKDRDLPKLIEYAKKLNIEEVVNNYLEILIWKNLYNIKLIRYFVQKLIKFYETGDNKELKNWLYETSIDGIDLNN